MGKKLELSCHIPSDTVGPKLVRTVPLESSSLYNGLMIAKNRSLRVINQFAHDIIAVVVWLRTDTADANTNAIASLT